MSYITVFIEIISKIIYQVVFPCNDFVGYSGINYFVLRAVHIKEETIKIKTILLQNSSRLTTRRQFFWKIITILYVFVCLHSLAHR